VGGIKDSNGQPDAFLLLGQLCVGAKMGNAQMLFFAQFYFFFNIAFSVQILV
jgi:hypothetical protein